MVHVTNSKCDYSDSYQQGMRWVSTTVINARDESIRKTMQQVDNQLEGSLRTIARQKAKKERTIRINYRKQDLDLIPDHNAETAFAERLFVPLEERGVVKWLLTALGNNKHRLEHSRDRRREETVPCKQNIPNTTCRRAPQRPSSRLECSSCTSYTLASSAVHDSSHNMGAPYTP